MREILLYWLCWRWHWFCLVKQIKALNQVQIQKVTKSVNIHPWKHTLKKLILSTENTWTLIQMYSIQGSQSHHPASYYKNIIENKDEI